MAIYLCFLQHILWSLKDNGKAAIVVPTGFITAQSGIEKRIRQTMVDNRWLKGVISMPSNIFANTGTNVSVLFIDKSNSDGKVMLVDASNLGKKIKEGKNQRTILSDKEVRTIEETFIHREVVEDFSVLVTFEEIQEKNYSLAAGQYCDVKIVYIPVTQQEFDQKIAAYVDTVNELFMEGNTLQKEIAKQLTNMCYKGQKGEVDNGQNSYQ